MRKLHCTVRFLSLHPRPSRLSIMQLTRKAKTAMPPNHRPTALPTLLRLCRLRDKGREQVGYRCSHTRTVQVEGVMKECSKDGLGERIRVRGEVGVLLWFCGHWLDVYPWIVVRRCDM